MLNTKLLLSSVSSGLLVPLTLLYFVPEWFPSPSHPPSLGFTAPSEDGDTVVAPGTLLSCRGERPCPLEHTVVRVGGRG